VIRVANLLGLKMLVGQASLHKIFTHFLVLEISKNVEIRPPFQALLTFEKLVKLYVFDHISRIKTDN